MIIWGWKTVFRVIGSGVFSCPTCGADRNYERRKAQRFFTLFFIPLIPLKVVGEFIRCTYCKNDFRESVLARPTAAQFTDLLQNTVRGVMVNVLRRGGWEHPGARAIAVQEIVNAGAVGYGEPNLAQDMQVVPEDLSQMLAGLAAQLPDAGREALVTGAARVAAADGPVQPAERAVIDTVGAGLGMSQAHVSGIVAAVPVGTGGAAGAPAWGSGTGQQTGQQTVPHVPSWGTGPQGPAAGSAGPAWGTGQQAPAAGNAGPGWGSGPQAPAAGTEAPAWGTGAQAPAAASSAGMETMMIPVPQQAPGTGPHDAVPPQSPAGSGMETMMIQAPQPAPPTGSHGTVPPQTPAGSGRETMMIQAPQPPQPAQDTPADSSGMQTMMIPLPQPARQDAVPEPPMTLPEPPANAMETRVIPLPPQQPSVPAPPQTMVDQSSSMETMIVPLNQVPTQRPVDPADEPTHVTQADSPNWPPPHQQQ